MTPGAALLVALLSQAVSGTALESAPAMLRLDVRAPAACTSREDLAARITARSPRIEIADDASLAAQVVITVFGPSNVAAEILLGSDKTPRRVVARSCAEAADGAALIIAVTLDPSLRRTSGKGPAKAPPSRAKVEAATPVPPTPPLPPPVPPQPASKAPRPAPPAGRCELGATLGGQAIAGAAPAVLPGVALYATAALDREGLWAPALYLGVTHVWRSDLAQSGGAASFTLDAVSLDACPLALRWSRLVIRPCAAALIGRLASRGSRTVQPLQPASAARPFGTAGGALAATWGARWQLLARLGLGATLIRDSYDLAAVFYKAAPVTFSATLGAGLSWR